jgi:diguanylate cyclase (GGDEF)-like protein/PAS domain S-box-containing protein
MILDLINNAAMLLAVCWLQSLITYRWPTQSLKAQFVSGVLFGLATVAIMMMYIYLMPGLWSWVDASIVIVSIATLIYGPIVGGVAAAIACSYRLWMGGVFAVAGTTNIVLALVLGLVFRFLVNRGWLKLGLVQLLVFGLVAHVVAFLQPYYAEFVFPDDGVQTYILSVLAVMAPATAILGLQLQYIERKKALELSIQRSEARLRAITEAIPDQLMVFDRNGRFLEVLAPAAMVANASRIVGRHIKDILSGSAANQYENLIKRVFSTGATERAEHSAAQPYILAETENGDYAFESKASKVQMPLMDEAALVLTRDITERKRAEERVRYMAYYDTLTGLPNRNLALEKVADILADAKLNHDRFAVLLITLDKFKLINEIYGFDNGSWFLKEAAQRLADTCGQQPFLARYAGDQFLVIVGVGEDNDPALDCCRDILAAMAKPYDFQGEKVSIQVSLGLSIFPDDSVEVATLFRQAGTANELSKQSGSAKYHFYHTDMEASAKREMDLRNALSQAIENRELELFYQPLICLSSGKITGMEALLRWNHPRLGIQDPGYFMSLAEDTGLIVPMGEWVIREACQQARQWQQAGLYFGAMSVNVSTVQLERSRLETVVTQILDSTGLPHALLHLELTESTLLRTLEHAFLAADQLKAQGIRLSIDNFGTGYTRFDNLRRLNIARLKIDRRFIKDLADDEDSRAIVRAMVEMSAIMKLETVAIGVETESCLALLKDIGCDSAQGYYFSKPMDSEAATLYLQQSTG